MHGGRITTYTEALASYPWWTTHLQRAVQGGLQRDRHDTRSAPQCQRRLLLPEVAIAVSSCWQARVRCALQHTDGVGVVVLLLVVQGGWVQSGQGGEAGPHLGHGGRNGADTGQDAVVGDARLPYAGAQLLTRFGGMVWHTVGGGGGGRVAPGGVGRRHGDRAVTPRQALRGGKGQGCSDNREQAL